MCVEPHGTVRYSCDVTLDSSVRCVQLYSSVLLGVGKWRMDETTVHKLKPVPAVENSPSMTTLCSSAKFR